MKAYGLFLSAGLASALQIGNGGLNLGANSLLNGSFDSSASNFDPAALGLNLGNLNVGGLNLGNLDFSNRDAMAQAIQALLGSLCLNNALDLNSIQNLGLNNEADLLIQLAQLQQLQSLGFLDLGGVSSLVNNGLLGSGLNVGFFKREVAEAKKTMRRTKLRRGAKVTKRQCQQAKQSNQSNQGNQGNQNPNSANSAAKGSVTAPAASAAAKTSAAAAKASSAPAAAATSPVAAAASSPAAVASASPVASVAPAAAAPAPAAAAPAPPAASAGPASTVPEAAPAAAPAAAPGGGENLSDFTR